MEASSSEWLYQQIIEGAQDAIVFADPDGIIRLWNSGAEAIFGYSAEEALSNGHRCHQVRQRLTVSPSAE
jgi:PAS domain S-box-containing protein